MHLNSSNLKKLIILEQAKRKLGIPEIQGEMNSLMNKIYSECNSGEKPWKEFFRLAKLRRKLIRLWKKELPRELKRMGYDPKEILE